METFEIVTGIIGTCLILSLGVIMTFFGTCACILMAKDLKK